MADQVTENAPPRKPRHGGRIRTATGAVVLLMAIPSTIVTGGAAILIAAISFGDSDWTARRAIAVTALAAVTVVGARVMSWSLRAMGRP